MSEPITIIWLDEVVEHIEEHNVTVEEADEVIRDYFNVREPSRGTPGRFVVQGYTQTRRFLVVAIDFLERESIVVPATAFEPEPES